MLSESRQRKNLSSSKKERMEEGVKIWVSFWRANIHRFVLDYLDLPLFTFQIILLYMMDINDMFMFIASRGLGKSYLVAVYCCAKAILYPGIKIVIGSGTKGQARTLVSQKIGKELMSQSPMLRREIKDIKTSTNDVEVIFHNGSSIIATASNDNARGLRANILIIDEFRMVKTEVINRVMKPFLNVIRLPRFYTKPEYANYPKEENKEIYMSSAWFRADDSYLKFKAFVKAMCTGGKYFVCDLPYTLAINHGLLTQERADNMRKEEDMDEVTWAMEMEGLWYGEGEDAFFKSAEINPCRTLIKAFNPPSDVEYLQNKDKRKKSTKLPDEIRIISGDIALMGGNGNDNSIFTLIRLIPSGQEYIREVSYIESFNGSHSEKQAIRIKQLFNDFEADYIALDCQGNGMAVYDELVKVQYDQDRDEEYMAYTCFNDEKMAERCMSKNALSVIFSIKVVKAEVNHEIALSLKDGFQQKKIKLLINDIEGKDFLIEKLNLLKKSPEEQARMLKPYLQTTAMVNETINLEYQLMSGFIKVKEKGRNRKDRYSSLAYGNYLAKILEKDLRKEKRSRSNFVSLW